MPKFRIFLILMSILAARAEDKPVHLFILSGQSNMKGISPEKHFDPEANKLFPDGKVVYIKVAQGGRPIREWVNEWNEIAQKHQLTEKSHSAEKYQSILTEYKAQLEQHQTFASVTFFWMQGEADGKGATSVAYKDALKQLIANLRRDLNVPKMAFIIGRISDYQTTDEWNAVRKAQVEVANGDATGAWVDTDDLNDGKKAGNPYNDLHYNNSGYATLGQRFVRQAKALLDGRKPAENGRPE